MIKVMPFEGYYPNTHGSVTALLSQQCGLSKGTELISKLLKAIVKLHKKEQSSTS